MNFFLIILFYTFASSILFVYGIGLERLFIYLESPQKIYFFLLKNFFLIFLGITFLWFFCRYILNPLSLNFLLPLFIVIFLELLDFILEFVYKKIWPKFYVVKPEEKVFSWGLVFFCLYQAATYKECIALIVTGIFSLVLFLFVLNAIKQKIDNNESILEWKKISFFLISIGLILSAFYLTDVSPFF